MFTLQFYNTAAWKTSNTFLHRTVQIYSYILGDELAKYACLPNPNVFSPLSASLRQVLFCGGEERSEQRWIESFQVFPAASSRRLSVSLRTQSVCYCSRWKAFNFIFVVPTRVCGTRHFISHVE